jgi:hypothetical protein
MTMVTGQTSEFDQDIANMRVKIINLILGC